MYFPPCCPTYHHKFTIVSYMLTNIPSALLHIVTQAIHNFIYDFMHHSSCCLQFYSLSTLLSTILYTVHKIVKHVIHFPPCCPTYHSISTILSNMMSTMTSALDHIVNHEIHHVFNEFMHCPSN